MTRCMVTNPSVGQRASASVTPLSASKRPESINFNPLTPSGAEVFSWRTEKAKLELTYASLTARELPLQQPEAPARVQLIVTSIASSWLRTGGHAASTASLTSPTVAVSGISTGPTSVPSCRRKRNLTLSSEEGAVRLLLSAII
jgi:hypothetical protein